MRYSQNGAALILFMTIMVLGISALLLSELNTNTDLMLENQEQTAKVLIEAKEALIAFAEIYAQTHSGQPQGYLPCPDYDGDGDADPICPTGTNTENKNVIGRLPWKTLGLPPLRDGSGECLWYAVSGTYKDNSKQPLTSDTNGLFIVENANGNKIAGSSPENQAIAIIFAPGKILKDQKRGFTPNQKTECGSTQNGSAPDDINKVGNYLDNYQINNATGNNTLSYQSSGNSGFFTTSNPLDTSTFISAPLTYDTYTKDGKEQWNMGKVIFNDTLMLITPKDFEPVYERMNYWVAKRVNSCLQEYSQSYLDKYQTEIDDYKNTHKIPINTYAEGEVQKYKTKYKTNNDNVAPSSEQIETKRTQLKENAVVISSKYPWLLPLNSDPPNYNDANGHRFGRIYYDISGLIIPLADNNEMPKEWPTDPTINNRLTNLKIQLANETDPNKQQSLQKRIDELEPKIATGNYQCFNEDADLDNWTWGWWDQWKEEVFVAIDNNNTPSTPTYIYVRGDWTNTVAKLESGSLTQLVPGAGTPTTPLTPPTNTLTLNNDLVEKVVLVAGRTLLLNPNSSMLDYSEYQQIRETNGDKQLIKNYLEGKQHPTQPELRKMTEWNIPETGNSDTIPTGDEHFYGHRALSNFNDVACSKSGWCPY